MTDMVEFSLNALTVLVEMPRDMQEVKVLHSWSYQTSPKWTHLYMCSLRGVSRWGTAISICSYVTCGWWCCSRRSSSESFYMRDSVPLLPLHHSRAIRSGMSEFSHSLPLYLSLVNIFFIRIIWMCFRTIQLLGKSQTLFRHFVDSFGPLTKLLKPLLLQLKPALNLAENVEVLRSSYFLNPINEGDKMGMPSAATVRLSSLSFTCNELN